MGYIFYETRVPITVDGRLDEAGWRAVPSTEDFQDIRGEPTPCFRSGAKVLRDGTYVSMAAEDPAVLQSNNGTGAAIADPSGFTYLERRSTIICRG
jgi:hypothetical protein